MQRVTYRKTLDVTSGGVQFLLQGFETADRVSRRIDISLMSDGDTYDIPSGNVTALMYVRQPDSETTEMYECEIKNNRIIYDARPITNEGIALMQLELVRTDAHNNVSVLVAPKFEVEVLKSEIDGTAIENEVDVSAIEKAIGKAEKAYNSRLLSIEIDEDCIFRAEYEGKVTYTTDLLRRLFLNGEAELAKSYAEGDTGIRVGENADNAKHYSDVAKSESEKAKQMLAESKNVLADIRLQGTQTFFTVNFETGEVEYISPSYEFAINEETGELDALRQTQKYDEVIQHEIDRWLEAQGVDIADLNSRVTHNEGEIKGIKVRNNTQDERINSIATEIRQVEHGGTGASTIDGVLEKFGLRRVYPGDYYELISTHTISNELVVGVGSEERHSTDLNLESKIDNYDELVFVLNGTYSISEPGTFDNRKNLLRMGISTKTNSIDYSMLQVHQNDAGNDGTAVNNAEISGLSRRFFYEKRAVVYVGDGVGGRELSTTYVMKPLNGEEISTNNFYFNVMFKNENGGVAGSGSASITAKFDAAVNVYGRSRIFKNQEE